MNNKFSRIIVSVVVSWYGMSQAHTVSEEDACVRELVRAYEGAVENSDCVEEDVPEGEDEGWDYPTINHLFATQLGPRCVSTAWTAEERRQAFENYMSRLSSKDRRQMSQGDIVECTLAFSICSRFGYTNCLSSAEAVVQSECAPEKDMAFRFLCENNEPSVAMNGISHLVATNTNEFCRYDRHHYVGNYLKKVSRLSSESIVLTNAIAQFYATRQVHNLYYELDELFLAKDPSFANSTNRYALALEALTASEQTSFTKAHYQSITNRLGRAIAP